MSLAGSSNCRRSGLVEAQRATRLDPVNVGYAVNVANALTHLGRNQEALAYLAKALELDPRSQSAHGSMANVYEALHQYGQAEEEVSQTGDDLAMARIQAEGGKREQARAILRHYLELNQAGLPASPVDIAALYAALNERDETFQWLDRACKEHTPVLMFLKVDPRFAALRIDPRFSNLVEQIHP